MPILPKGILDFCKQEMAALITENDAKNLQTHLTIMVTEWGKPTK